MLALLAVAALIAACGDSSDGVQLTTPGPEGVATIGQIEHFPGGQATITSDHVLVSISCENGVITMVTSAGRFTGTMDCQAQVGQDVLDRFVGKPIAITITDARLKIENPEAGSLDYPATDVVVE